MRLWLFLALLFAGPVMAQEALYGAQPPPGSAFVRYVNTTGSDVAVIAGNGPLRMLHTEPTSRVTDYSVVDRVAEQPLHVQLLAGSKAVHATLNLAPASFATVLVSDDATGGLTAILAVDSGEFNQARARLAFYNAAPGCETASLTLAPSGAAIFSNLPPATSRSRTVNPSRAQMLATCRGETATETTLERMEVGGSYSVWLMTPTGLPLVFTTRDRIAAYKAAAPS